ncbi:hypothetical protein [Chryseobacterium lineare]
MKIIPRVSKLVMQEYPDTSGTEISYDTNGNMKDHMDKGILQIDYNILDLPDLIKFDKTYVPRFTGMELDYNVKTKYLYRADGVKLRKIYNYGIGRANLEASTITDYLDGFQYEEKYTGSLSSPVLKFVHTSEGYYDFEKNKYIYTYTDHLDRRVKEKLLRRLRTQFCTSELRQKYNQWQRRSS